MFFFLLRANHFIISSQFVYIDLFGITRSVNKACDQQVISVKNTFLHKKYFVLWFIHIYMTL